ncbi:hypothetical protein [Ottowia sp.]|jgi:hypothetical protein|uniref:hypothetical protein n=1 Tax=Ottowia sp. TaxID=1898956 RepID=UPI0025E5A1F8|nr:hypothetical protein [Ottowia sp.]MBK6615831.1 hypothetical protein [Ottowia sp.]MBK6746879.1 hypothetical protein [Ottowia sp.]
MPYLHPCGLLLAAALACASAGKAQAVPYSLTYAGTIQNSQIPGVINGEKYQVTLVFDNGGASSNSQTWEVRHLTCVFWSMNNAANVRFIQNLAGVPPYAVGSVTTGAAGNLLTMFSEVSAAGPTQPGHYAATGLPGGAVNWWANGMNYVFRTNTGQTRTFEDAAGGVRMQAALWGSPNVVRGGCPAPAAPSGTVAVPALGPWGLAALAGSLGLIGMRRRALKIL